jgi:hypothetical protein
MTLGHTRARYFAPETGGLIPLGGFAGGVFRIDHDQAYQQTAVFRYQRPHNREWVNFTWRYDSGLVVSGVPDVEAALALTAAQQVAIGFVQWSVGYLWKSHHRLRRSGEVQAPDAAANGRRE